MCSSLESSVIFVPTAKSTKPNSNDEIIPMLFEMNGRECERDWKKESKMI